jgi:glucose/arabinose dehydrogenase
MVVTAAVSAVGCRNATVAPPAATSGPITTVTGKERVGWTQAAADTAELATFHYAIYVDNVRSELTGASCSPSSTPSSFDCSAPLPDLSPGLHTLQITSYSVNGGFVESIRSPALQVNKVSAVAPSPVIRSTPAVEWPSEVAVTTSDELHLRLDRIARGLVNPTDIAFLPDGRALVAEQPGRVRIITVNGELLPAPALVLGRGDSAEIDLLSLAADQHGSVYAVYAAPSRVGSRVFTVARFREASNVLIGGVPVLDSVDASAAAAASVRVDTDGKLFVAIDDAGDPGRGGDFASPNGKILRLNPDGTTPDDQAGLSPMYLSDLHSPAGFDWQPGSRVLWIADRIAEGQASLSAVTATVAAGRRRGTRLASYALPAGAQPSSATFYASSLIPRFTNDLFIASEQGRHLLRVEFDQATGTKVSATERLLQDTIGGVRAVAVSPAGKIYVATADSLGVLTPDP